MEETQRGEFNFMRRGGGVEGTWRDVGDWISTGVGGVKMSSVLMYMAVIVLGITYTDIDNFC